MKTRIITFCNKRYLPLAAIWLKYIRQLSIDNYLVIATDGATYEELVGQGANARLIDMSKAGYTSINGQYRMRIVYQYLVEGFDVVLSDLDIVWKKNILAEYEDTSFDIHTAWNSLATLYPLNCGFIYARTNKKVLRFFSRYVMELAGCDRDQPAFNRLLQNTQWNINDQDIRRIWFENRYFRRLSIRDLSGYNPDFDLRLHQISAFKIQRGYVDADGYLYHYRIFPPGQRLLILAVSRPLQSHSQYCVEQITGNLPPAWVVTDYIPRFLRRCATLASQLLQLLRALFSKSEKQPL